MWRSVLLAATFGAHASQSQRTFNVLIAGFGPFAEPDGTTFVDNPAAEVALFLDNTCSALRDLLPAAYGNSTGRVCFSGWNVTVDHRGASEVQRALLDGSIQRAGLDAVVHLGLENSARGLKVEVTGANVLADGRFEGEKIDPLGPAIAPATLDLGRLDVTEVWGHRHCGREQEGCGGRQETAARQAKNAEPRACVVRPAVRSARARRGPFCVAWRKGSVHVAAWRPPPLPPL